MTRPGRKHNQEYRFTVEGETEKWYLERLKQLINTDPAALSTVSIVCKVEKNPKKYVKSISAIAKVEITHWYDYESNGQEHVDQFLEMLGNLKAATRLGKKIKYDLGYSNLTFELWMALHKIDCNSHVEHRDHYLRHVNRAFGAHFADLDTYKREANFKRVLESITLSDVKDAIRRAHAIMNNNRETGLQQLQHSGYAYFRDNPSLTVHESVEKILKTCGLLP